MTIRIDDQLLHLAGEVEKEIIEGWNAVREVEERNQTKVLEAFVKHKVDYDCLAPGSGYGYGDAGREKLEKVFADVFAGESSIVRPQLVSGTHAISACLFALLEKGDRLISAVGAPYDTLSMVIGDRRTEHAGPVGKEGRDPIPRGRPANSRTLLEKGVEYLVVDVTSEGDPDVSRIKKAVADFRFRRGRTIVLIQRSRGYSQRRSLSVADIADIIQTAKSADPQVLCMVDNCYGEFVEEAEPGDVGADLVVGSLIKNPGGGLAPGGGYIVGKTDLIEEISSHIIAPGLGRKIGTLLGLGRELYQGIFLAPHVVAESVKGATFAAGFMKRLGFTVSPDIGEKRSDTVQVIYLGDAARLHAFCAGIQKAGPIGSHFVPEAALLPGYSDPILMAGGSFVQGSSIELSADAPLRPPYCVFLQGGLTYTHVKLGVILAAQELTGRGLITLPGSHGPDTFFPRARRYRAHPEAAS